MILVTTAGKVGSAAARVLAEQGGRCAYWSATQRRRPTWPGAGAEVVQGDLAVPATVETALRGVTAIVLVSPAVPDQEVNVIAGAVQSGVRHVVKITGKASADSPIARRRDQATIEEVLIASGLGWMLLRNNAYMQNFLMLAPAIAGSSEFGSSTGDGRIGMVDTRDVGAIAAEIATSPADHTAIEVGIPEAVAQMNAQAMDLFARGDSEWTTDDVPSILGRPARTFTQFVPTTSPPFCDLGGPA